MSVFLSISETANLLGVSSRAIQKAIKSDKYTTQQVKGRGGLRYEIALSSLPEEAQQRYQNQKLEAVADSMALPVITQKTELVYKQVDLFELTDRQRDIDRFRATVVKFVEALNLPIAKALRQLNAGYGDGSLPANVRFALENALEKREFKGISREVYYGWLRIKGETGCYAPKKREKDFSVQWWHDMALVLYRRPQKPTVQYVVEKLAETVTNQGFDSIAPSYGQVERFFKDRFSQSGLHDGRYTGMARRALKYHKVRTAAGMLPWDEIHADGWATHFTAPHPVTGDYVTLEVWDAHDVATRFVPPLAVGLTENYEVIAKCFENAIREGGVMAHLMTDSTKIVKRNTKFVGNPVLSISDRAGVTIVHPKTVGNAQANGISENFHTYLDREARELSTYQHDRADSLSFRRTQKLTTKLVKAKNAGDVQAVDKLRKDIAKTSKGLLFESFQDAVDWLESKRVKWNNHEHKSLKSYRDNETGKKRYQTPQQAFDEFKALGWLPVAMDEDHLVDLFRPRVQVKVFRGVVKPYGSMRFRNAELDHWEGKLVAVSYDIMDYSNVRVMDLSGSLICVAEYDAPVGYRGQTAQEAAEEKRAVAAIKRKERGIEAIKSKSRSLSVIDSTAVVVNPLKRVEFEPMEIAPVLQRVEFISAEEADEPKLRTLADMLAEASEGEDFPSQDEPLPYWGTVSDDDDETKEDVL